MEESELNSSELGTQEYWKEAYIKEITNFDENGDPGDVWFGEDCAERVVNWITKSDIDRNTAIIDLGCGNGYTLLELARRGFTNLLGVDYCAEAITLAQKVAQSEFPSVLFQVFDITEDNLDVFPDKFGLAHDKGTYDAISLNPDKSKENRQKYVHRVAEMMRDDGLFIITSCNWTQDELLRHFSEKMKPKCVIPTPQFKFGGKVGSSVTSIVFGKNNL